MKETGNSKGQTTLIYISNATGALCTEILKSRFLGNFSLDMKSQCWNLWYKGTLGGAGRMVKS